MAGTKIFKKNQSRQEAKSKILQWREQLQSIAEEMHQELEKRQQEAEFDNRDVLICEFINTSMEFAKRATDELRLILGEIWIKQ